MIDDIAMQSLLESFRGEPPVNRETLADILCSISQLGEDSNLLSIDLNPLIISDGEPIAVDALVEIVEDK
ncbi:MAG: Uncharacterised protein [Acidimicrobiales bacterium AG-410-I20]|nr:MAG: Uncharacterised protein [Acidimicrobiales bacterium AG-410-I20]